MTPPRRSPPSFCVLPTKTLAVSAASVFDWLGDCHFLKWDIAQELHDDLETLQAAKRGEVKLRERTYVEVAPPAEIRARLNLSQHAFAAMLGVSLRTVQEWEQGRAQPSGPASALLRIADQAPEVFFKLR